MSCIYNIIEKKKKKKVFLVKGHLEPKRFWIKVIWNLSAFARIACSIKFEQINLLNAFMISQFFYALVV